LRTNAPLTDINKNVVPLVQPISLPEAQPADTRTPKNMLSLIVTLIVLTVVIIVGLFIWAYTRGPNPAKVNSRTPSTRLELRDTLNPHRLS
jgi:heme/copper-type cytochrome/quinol oxidase subunit 2